MVAIIRHLRAPEATNAAPYRPPVMPNMVVRVKAPPPPKKPKVLALGPFVIQQTTYIGWERARVVGPLEMVARTVCEVWQVARNDLFSQRRHRKLAHPRQATYLLAKEFTDKSFPEIGRFFKRDHTTVLYGLRVAGKREDAEYRALLEMAREKLRDALK